MRKKAILIASFFVLVLLSMSSVVASDLDDATMQATNNTLNDVVVSDDAGNQYIGAGSEDATIESTDNTSNHIVESEEGNAQDIGISSEENNGLGDSFSDLQSRIDATPEGGTLTLNQDYSIDEGGKTLKISKSIVINGNDHSIMGDNTARLITIESNEKTVILQNIVFWYGYSSDKGGAIYNSHSSTKLILNSCTFYTNIAETGGAIYTVGDLNISSSTFENCNASGGDGGAVYCGGKLYIYESEFSENAAGNLKFNGHSGGAVYSKGKCTIVSSTFISNTAKDGSAIYACDDLVIIGHDDDGNRFHKNTASFGTIYAEKNLYINWNSEANQTCGLDYNSHESIGAIYCKGNIYAKNLYMYKNDAGGGNDLGAAIHCEGETHINSSEFRENRYVPSATMVEFIMYLAYGGAICSQGKCYIDSCQFYDNYAVKGGAIYAHDDLTITGENNVFQGNTLDYQGKSIGIYYQKDGGAIYCCGNLFVNNTQFIKNNATIDGGAIYCEKECKIYNSNFEKNIVTGYFSRKSWGGAICTDKLIIAENCNFTDNNANPTGINGVSCYGGAIYIASKCDPEFIGCIFHNNEADLDGGAIYIDADDVHLKVTDCTFSLNKAGTDGGAIYCPGETTITGSEFRYNRAIKRYTADSYGGAIRSKGLITIDGSIFENNHANNFGGAIYGDDQVRITDSSFTGNYAKVDGGAIYSNGFVGISNSRFENNNATGETSAESYGGAIRSNYDAGISNSIFEDNFAYNLGGVIYVDGDIQITGSTFNNNKARVDGGAIYSEGKTDIYNSKFTGNKATGEKNSVRSFGGAVFSNGEMTAQKCLFDDNFAYNYGGAIYADQELHIIASNFTNNLVYVDGGAVYSDSDIDISDSIFHMNNAIKNTSARSFGGAVHSEGVSTVKGSNFTNNFATNRGGAIFAPEVIIKDSNFISNTAGDYGGAVYTRTINQEVVNSTFNKNKVSNNDGGAIYINNSCNPQFNLCTFEDNKAPERGGAIYVDSKSAPLRLSFSNFTGNKAGEGGAVYTGTMYGVNRYSVFLNNTATSGDGGAIYINNDCTVHFASCRFENNHCDNRGGAIYLDSKSAELSLQYCTFVDNVAEKNHYNGTYYHHGGGQSVFNSGDYQFIDQCWFGKNDPSYKDQFVVYHESADDKDYRPDNCLKIEMKMNVTEFYIGREYQVKVYFYTLKLPNPISDETFYIYLNGDLLHSDGHFSGWAEFSNENVGFNNMTANVLLTNDKPWIVLQLDHQIVTLTLKANNTTSSEVRILSCENVTYPNSVNVDYEIFNMTTARYTVYDVDGTPIFGGKITNPKGRLTIDNLIVGKYSIDIINTGNNSVNASTASASFNVYKDLGTVNVTADNVTYGENTTITLKADTDGLYNVSINGTVLEMEVINGIATRQIKLNASNYQTHTSVGEGGYINCKEASFTVYKADPNFKIYVSKDVFDYGEDILVTYDLAPDAGSLSPFGAFAYYINNVWYANFELNDEVKFTGLNAGSYFVEAYYSGDMNYNLSKSNVSFTVVKPENNVIVNVSNVTYGESSVIEIYADVDGTYQVDVNGTVYDITVSNGFGNKSIALDAGIYYANASYDNDNYITTVQNTSFRVYKADIDLVIVVFDEVYGDEVECLVYADRDGAYNLTIADHSTVITVKDSFAYYEHSTMDAGTYQATVSFAGDRNYYPAFNITTFTVYPAGTKFELEVNPNPISYGETATVTHTLPEDATGTIKYYLSNGTFLGELGLSESLTLPVLDAGTYHIIGNYSGDHNYIPSTDSTVLTVNKLDNNVVVSASNVTYGNETLIEISADLDGIYHLDVNGTVYNITVENGHGSKSLTLDAGTYYANVSFEDKNYNTRIENATFKVDKADIHLILIALDTVYSIDLEGAIYSDLDGEYNVTVGNYSAIVTVTNGLGEFNAGILDAGSYEIVANYSGDRNHNPAVKTFPVTVHQKLNYIEITASNVTYGNETLIEVYAGLDGTYALDVNGTVYNVTVSNGIGNKSIALDAGIYNANISFENKNYNTTVHNASFEVYKASTMIFVVAYHCVYPDAIEGIVLADVDGEYNLTVGDYSSTIIIEDGFANFNAGVFDAGNYTVFISYPGDRNHMANSSSDDVTVFKYSPEITLSVEDIDYGGVAVISISCDVPGSVNVTVNGVTETIDLNGQNKKLLFASLFGASSSYNASLSLYNLDSGKYPVRVTYNGDKNYESVIVSDEFNVNPLNVTMDVDANDIKVGDEETITVKLSPEANGTVTVTVDGKNYTAQVKDGKAVITIPGLSAGKKNAEIHYSGDTNYNPASTNVSFTVSKNKPDMSVSSNEPNAGEKIHITVTLPKDATGTVTISLEGKNYTAPVKNGNAVFNIPGLKAGKYDFTAYYSGDDKYEEAQIDSSITVKDNGGNDDNNTDDNGGNDKNHTDKRHSSSNDLGLKSTGNPIFILLLSLMTIALTDIRRFKE